MKERGYDVGQTIPVLHCKLFEDNAGALCLAKAPAMQPRTKHIKNKKTRNIFSIYYLEALPPRLKES
jgi:hypothetical protein